MKKLLLMVAMTATTMCGFAQTGVDITPSKYIDWAGGTCVAPKWEKNSNIASRQSFKDIIGGDYDSSGAIIFSIGAGNPLVSQGKSVEDISQGVTIVDLGGTVGKVWAFSGVNSNVSQYFNNFEFPKAISIPNWINMHVFTDDNRTPKGGDKNQAPEGKYMHVKMVMNICGTDPSSAQAIYSAIYAMTIENVIIPEGSNQASNVSVTPSEFTTLIYDEEEEMAIYKYDKTKWMVYEFDTWAPSDDQEGKSYTPMRIKMEFPGVNGSCAINNATVFIKEISFTEMEGEPQIKNKERKKSFITLTPEGTPKLVTTGVESITVNAQSNGMIYNLAGQRVQNAQNGIFIQNGKKVIK